MQVRWKKFVLPEVAIPPPSSDSNTKISSRRTSHSRVNPAIGFTMRTTASDPMAH
jgi:hypothetical protein